MGVLFTLCLFSVPSVSPWFLPHQERSVPSVLPWFPPLPGTIDAPRNVSYNGCPREPITRRKR